MGSYISGSQINNIGPRLKKNSLQAVNFGEGWGGGAEAPDYIVCAKKTNSNQWKQTSCKITLKVSRKGNKMLCVFHFRYFVVKWLQEI